MYKTKAMKTGAISKVPTLASFRLPHQDLASTLCHLVHTTILGKKLDKIFDKILHPCYSFAHHLTTTIHPAYLHSSSTFIAIHMHPSEPYHSASYSHSLIRIHPYLAPRNVETNTRTDIYN